MRLSMAIAIASLSIVSLSTANEVQAAVRLYTAIPAQGLGPALQQLAKEREVQLVYRSEVVGNSQTSGVTGALTLDEALAQLLSGTGLTYRYLDNDAITIVPVGTADSGRAGAPAEGAALRSGESALAQEAAVDANLTAGAEQRGAAGNAQGNGKKSIWMRLASAADPQQSTETRTSSAKTETPEEIPTVVVTGLVVKDVTTAGRVELPLRDVPQSVQLVTQRLITEQAAVRATEVITNASGVWRGAGFGNTQDEFFVRGFRVNNIYKDGISNRFFAGMSELANAERIEVLKGPSSAVYGQAEPGGIVNIVTKRPLFTPRATLNLQAGSDEFYKGTFDLTGPLSGGGTLAGRLVTAYEDSESFRDFMGQESVFVAPSVLWKPTGSVTLTLYGEYLDQNGKIDSGIPVVGRHVPDDVPLERNLSEPWNYAQFETGLIGAAAAFDLSDAWRMQLSARHLEVDEHDLYVFPTLTADNRTATRRAFEPQTDAYTQDANLDFIGDVHWGSMRHRILFGAEGRFLHNFFMNRNAPVAPIDMYNPVYGAPIPVMPAYVIAPARETEAYGAYLQDLVEFSPQWKVLAGVRFDHINDDRSGQEDEALSPRLGIVYQPVPSLSLYGSYSSAFLPTIGRSFDGSQFEPERSIQYEIGVKAALLDERVWATLAGYDLTRDNVLNSDPDNPTFQIQVGEQRSRGIELDVTGDVTEGLSLTLAYAYIEAEVTEDNAIPVGNQLAHIPVQSGRLWATYRVHSAGLLDGLGLGGGVLYQDARQGDIRNTFDMPSFTRVDATLFYEWSRWRASLNLTNLTDERYFEVAGNRTGRPGAPRSGMLSISYILAGNAQIGR